ncbi:MAG: SCP2 sterol-binding domain-containing protein [Luminiphilus sp.]
MTQHDPALLSAALAGAERAMNQAIAMAPTSHQALGGLSGTLLGVEVTTLDLTLYIEMVDATEIRLMTHCEDQPDAFVRGTLEDFGALATSEDPAATLINSGIELQGSSHSLIALQQVISRMDIDWEAPLVDLLGDVIGHQIAEGLRSVFRWGEGARASLKRQVSEYLLEEGRLTPPKAELEHFYDAVQSLAMRVDRAQNQFEKLLAKAALKRENQ